MTALAKNRQTQFKHQADVLAFPVVDNDIVFRGSLVMLTAAGLAAPGADTTACVFAGVAEEKKDNTGGAASALTIRVRRKGIFTFAYGAGDADQADVGLAVYITDDQTVDLAGVPTNDVFVGTITKINSVDSVDVLINALAGGVS